MIKKAYKHLRTTQIHRKWVRYYCFKVGLYKQGLTHDLSKYSPIEFWESVKYYMGTSSPINECKRINGYSMAWFHHRGRNKHHYEYWMDNFDAGGTPVLMPYKYAAEMFCDYLGAARAYMQEAFSFDAEEKWWIEKKKVAAMHPAIKKFLTITFGELASIERGHIYDPVETLSSKNYLLEKYRQAVQTWYD